MNSQYETLKKELDSLISKGQNLLISMHKECGNIEEKDIPGFEEKGVKFVSVNQHYQSWYTKSYRVIEQIIPERKPEFEKLYKGDEKRKEVTFINYSIYDYILGLQSSIGGKIKASKKDAITKMETQFLILKSASEKFKSSLFDIKEILQADIFDTELESAIELNKKGFCRAAGAVTGVILEKHLSHICKQHDLKSRKGHPTISDLNQLLKDNNTIDTATWRFIQHLGDIRNLCDHAKDKEPTKNDIDEFIKGTDKIIKTIF